MLPFITLAAAAAAAAGKLIYDAVTQDSPKPKSASAPSSGPTQEEPHQERQKQRSTQRARLVKEARGDAGREMQLILETHGDVVCGNAKSSVLLDDLREVAATAPHTEGVTALEPFTVGLNYTRAHRAEARRIEQLKREHAALRELIGSL